MSTTPPRQPKRVQAILVEAGKGSYRKLARCGNCRLSLWVIEGVDGVNTPRLIDHLSNGWRFNPETNTLRPTERSLARRRAIRAKVAAGTATDDERESLRFAGLRGRRGYLTPTGRKYFKDSLPVTIICPDCAAENLVTTGDAVL
jgi:hypothetical protein